MTRVIHTGDTHLGYRQYHSPERRRDFLAAFEAVVEDAVRDDVDAVVHAGDLFHDRQPSLADVHGAIDVLGRLRDADIPLLAVVGNHERTRDQQWLDLFETLGLATRLGREPVVIGDTAFYGLDYVPRSKRDDLAYEFEPTDAEHVALVAHGLFEPFAYADWDTETVLSEANVDVDAMLLGDNHAPDRAEVMGTWVTYCGSTERTEAGEQEDRGYNVVEFGESVSIRRRGLDTREFVFLDIDLSSGEGAERVRERLREEDLEDAVVVVRVEGDGEELPVARLETFAADRGALVARVTDRREFEAEEVPEVRFADPDDAVRDRLREMAPSEAALALDDAIRDGSIADANVRERATGRVRELLESEPEAFTTGGEVGDGGADATAEEGRTAAESETDEGADAGGSTAGSVTMVEEASTDDVAPSGSEISREPTAEEDDSADEPTGSPAETADSVETTSDSVQEASDSPEVGPEQRERGSESDDGGSDDDEEPAGSGDSQDEQVTMEDYL